MNPSATIVGTSPAAPAPPFDLEGVTFALDGRTLLEPLTFSLPARRVVALIGHNGSGKSTLLKLLARQLPATGGKIRFEGCELPVWNSREFARKVAYLPQQPSSPRGMRAKDLVALGRYPWQGALGRFSKTDREKIDEAIDLTDIGSLVDRAIDTLSGGERQRVWLAMLVAQDVKYLLLDEPISALDIAHQVEVLELIGRLARHGGLGAVIVLHDVNMAARFCDEIIALHSGRLIARGTPGELVRAEQLEAIFGVPMGALPHPGTGKMIGYVR